MARSTIRGFWRQRGTDTATPSVALQYLQFSLDPTQASAATGMILPRGAIVVGVQNLNGGATGGTNPVVDIGTEADNDGFVDGLDADGITSPITTGALLGSALTADTEIYAGVGAAAATGGTVLVAVTFIMEDDGQRA